MASITPGFFRDHSLLRNSITKNSFGSSVYGGTNEFSQSVRNRRRIYYSSKTIRAQILEEAVVSTDISSFEKQFQEIENGNAGKKTLKVLVAGAGIGGLVFALAAKNKGLDVTVRHLTKVEDVVPSCCTWHKMFMPCVGI